jgi:hypothetical protein
MADRKVLIKNLPPGMTCRIRQSRRTAVIYFTATEGGTRRREKEREAGLILN